MIEKNKLLGLEVIRFLSACLVLFAHYHFLCEIGIRRSLTTMAFYPFYDSLPFLYFLSEWAVRIFWCISGFIFFWKYQLLIADGKVSFRDFFISRFARLYPLHLLTLCMVAIGQAVYVHLTGFHYLNDVQYSVPHFVSQLFMAGNRVFTGDSFNWPIWSVSVEVTVYLMFFIVTRYLTKSIIFNFFIVVMFAIVSLGIPRTHFMGLFECLLFFYIGGAASMFKKYSLQRNFPSRLAWIGVGLIPLIFWRAGGFSSSNTVYLFWSVWLPVLLYCASDDFEVNAWVRRTIETLGNMTYSSYLIHIPVQLLMAIICFHWKIWLPLFNPLFLMGYLCFIFVLSYFVYRYFELPLKETIKTAARASGSRRKAGYLILFGICVHLCLAFTPIISLFEKDMASSSQKFSRDHDYSRFGKVFLDAGNYSQAIITYNKAIDRYPYDPDDYANLGIIYLKTGNYVEALANFDKALAMRPNYYMVYSNRAVVHKKQGRYDLALQDLNKAVSLDPCPESFPNPGKSSTGLDDFQKAMCLESAQIYFNLGFIYAKQSDYPHAINNFSKAITRNPNNPDAYEIRAICYLNMKDYVHARQDTQKAQALGAQVNPILLEAL